MVESNRLAFDYFKESQGYDVLEIPGEAFALYRVFKPEFHVGHIYIRPESRKQGKSMIIGAMLEALALEKGCTHMSCIVSLSTGKETVNSRLLKGYLNFGYEVQGTVGDQVILKKDLK